MMVNFLSEASEAGGLRCILRRRRAGREARSTVVSTVGSGDGESELEVTFIYEIML